MPQSAPLGIPAPSYRLPDDTRLGRVRLIVADLENSLAYYQQVLGFQVASRPASGKALLGTGDDVLLELEERPGVQPIHSRTRLGIYHFALLLPDRASLGSFAAHLRELGIQAGSADHLVSEAFYLVDPNGITIEVYADRPRSSWQHKDRELVMATDPLQLRSLLEAGSATLWKGLPPATVMGHVHFYVGDLAQAKAFYHAGLGMDQMTWSFRGALFVSAGGYHHHVGLNTWAAPAPVASDADARLLNWELILPAASDVEAASLSLTQAGFNGSSAPDGAAHFSDPWGTTLSLVAAG